MRKLYTGILALTMLGACNPMEDVYDELDRLEKPISKELEYTLTDADYATVAKLAYKLKTNQDSIAGKYIQTNKAFTEAYAVDKYLPGLFSSLYPGLCDGSSVKATYNYWADAPVAAEKVVFLTDKGDSEFYYGASTYNKNFSADVNKWKEYNKDVTVDKDLITARIREGVELVLKTKFAQNAVEGVVYHVRYALYKGNGIPSQMAFTCTKSGDKPEFEPVDDIEAVKTYEETNLYEYNARNKNYTKVKTSVGYVLVDEDFQGMDIRDNCFSSSYNSKNYLPQLLAMKLPYAQNGAKCLVAYRQDTDKGYTFYIDEYTYTDRVWNAYNPMIEKTDQFIYANGAWMFDPSVRFTMDKNDYQILVNWVAENKHDWLDTKYPDQTEYWFGASSYQKNFDMRISRVTKDPEGIYKGKSDDEVNAILLEQVKKGIMLLLETKYPDAVAQKNGVDIYYKVTYQIYDGTKKTYTMSFKCIDTGKFEFAEGPIQL